jgi:ribosome-associated protein
MADKKVQELVRAAVAAAESKKAEETRVLELGPADSALADYFVISSGNNARQNQAVADEIEFRLKTDFGAVPNSVEGYRRGEWILLDYVDFVVHIFLTEKREFYNIERLRGAATLFDATRPVKAKRAAAKRPAKGTGKKVAVKKSTEKKKPSK